MLRLLKKAIVRKLAASYVRKGLTILSTYLITSGVLEKTDMPALLEVTAELTPLIVAGIWSFIDAKMGEREVAAALTLPSNTPRETVTAVAKGKA